MTITKEIINRYGATSGCKKCRGLIAGDKAYQHVHHSEQCRTRLEDLMRNDDAYKEQVEKAEQRRAERLAEILERRVQAQDRQAQQEAVQKKRRREEHGVSSTEGRNTHEDPLPGAGPVPGAAASSSSAGPASGPAMQDGDGDTVMEDGIPLATPEVMTNTMSTVNMDGKRRLEQEEDNNARPRLQALQHAEGITTANALGDLKRRLDRDPLFETFPPHSGDLGGGVGVDLEGWLCL